MALCGKCREWFHHAYGSYENIPKTVVVFFKEEEARIVLLFLLLK